MTGEVQTPHRSRPGRGDFGWGLGRLFPEAVQEQKRSAGQAVSGASVRLLDGAESFTAELLSNADGVVLVLDSQSGALERNRQSLADLREHMKDNRLDPARVPIVLQLNKRDLPSAMDPAQLLDELGLAGADYVEAVASEGRGVMETLKQATRAVVEAVQRDARTGDGRITRGSESGLELLVLAFLHRDGMERFLERLISQQGGLFDYYFSATTLGFWVLWMSVFGGTAIHQVIADGFTGAQEAPLELKLFKMLGELPLASITKAVTRFESWPACKLKVQLPLASEGAVPKKVSPSPPGSL